MIRTFLHAKIHHCRVTACEPDYTGSIVIDRDLLDAIGMLPNEKVLVADCENGRRWETYVFEGERGSGEVAVNGAAARLSGLGHRLIIQSYCQLEEAEQRTFRPKVIVCDAHNRIEETIEYGPAIREAVATAGG